MHSYVLTFLGKGILDNLQQSTHGCKTSETTPKTEQM